MGRTEPMNPADYNMAVLFGSTLAAILVQAFLCDLILSAIRIGQHGLSVAQGAGWGFHLGLVTAFPSLSHRLFAGHGYKTWILEVGNDVLNFTMMGSILAYFG